MTKKIKKILGEVAAQMGKRGGLSGKGVSKIRGNSSYYRDMQRKAVAARLMKSKQAKSN